MKITILLTLLVSFLPVLAAAQDSDQKERLLAARERAAESDRNRRMCAKMPARQSLADNRCFSFYPTELMTWGKGFSNGLAKITVNGKAGFIDRQGAVVIRPTLRDAGRFSENLAPFESAGGKWGYLDPRGRVAIKPQFDWALGFQEGLALVQVGKLWGFIDRTGNFVIAPRFEQASSFAEGAARVGFYDPDYIWTLRPNMTNGKWRFGFIDRQGNWLIEPHLDGAARSFNGGMALVSRNVGFDNGVVSESYFIDRTGRELWILDSWYITAFSDGMMVVAVEPDDDGRDRFGFIDRAGQPVTDKTFSFLNGFSEGLSAARAEFGGKLGFIDKTGDFVIAPRFDWAGHFSEGLAAARIDSEGFGFIGKDGNFRIAPRFGWVAGFEEGFALVAPQAAAEKTGYIDRTGKYIWKPTK